MSSFSGLSKDQCGFLYQIVIGDLFRQLCYGRTRQAVNRAGICTLKRKYFQRRAAYFTCRLGVICRGSAVRTNVVVPLFAQLRRYIIFCFLSFFHCFIVLNNTDRALMKDVIPYPYNKEAGSTA